jgi:methylthioribose-1-phosphate isomerase
MQLPMLARYADILRYDRVRGRAAALDWRAYPSRRDLAEYASAEECARAIAAGAVGSWAAAYLAGYGLALAARAWADRPAETRRAAVIQAGEWLRRAQPANPRLARIAEDGIARADATILAGGDAEAALLDYVEAAIGRADKVAERCGRIAAGLLDEHDQVLTHGFGGPALIWMLAVARAEAGKQISMSVSAPQDQPEAAHIVAALAAELGVPAAQSDTSAPAQATIGRAGNILVLGADWLALDGGFAGASGAAEVAALARQQALPCYVLGYDGPDPACPTTGTLAAELGPGGAVVAPGLISAIITNRGIYRPEMIARYLGEGDPPTDVIPLSPG